MNFLFTCGGTAGHINPAIAIAERILELMLDARILFVGAEGMMESKRVPEAGFEHKTVRITNLQRGLSLDKIAHNLRTVKNVLISQRQATRILREFKPDVAVGTGGYVCYPVLSACRALRIPTVLHDSNAVPGLTTRMLAGRVDRLLVGYEDSVNKYKRGVNVTFTGTPVRGGFAYGDAKEAKAALGIAPETPLVVSVWGSLGSTHMNEIIGNLIRRMNGDFRLIHASGERGYQAMLDKLGESPEQLKTRGIDVRDYIHDMSRVMAAADIILCRAGASTLSELSVSAKPAILIPSPNVTNNHQEKNARVFESAGAAKVLLEGQFDTESLLSLITELLSKPETLDEMSQKMRSLAIPDATDRILDIMLGLATG